MYKRARYADRLAASDVVERSGDVHLLIGGTGAVCGESLIKMLRVYADLARSHGHPGVDGPVLVATGLDEIVRFQGGQERRRKLHELRRFRSRLWTLAEAEYGESPTRSGDTLRMPTGALVLLQEFSYSVLPRLAAVLGDPEPDFEGYSEQILGSRGKLVDALTQEIADSHQFLDLMNGVRTKIGASFPVERYRSIQIGIPLPSMLAYGADTITQLTKRGLLNQEESRSVKRALSRRISEELSVMRRSADHVLVAHTTAVGGMYDPRPEGETQIRLGFAHAARDANLEAKRQHAQRMSRLFADSGTWNLITAAAIGIDNVAVRQPLPLQKEMRRGLRNAPTEPFPGARRARFVHIHSPLQVPLEGPAEEQEAAFERMPRGGEMRPRFALRSGENGYLSPSNAEALYRVMRVASPSELGAVLALVGSLGDDPYSPWFEPLPGSTGRECYYDQTDNSRLVFDFLAQPVIRSSMLSGLEPQALVDLGSAKHQAELHMLGLLILLHRLRTLDLDAIPLVVQPDRFDAGSFFREHSRALTFEDIQDWRMEVLARDLQTLVLADRVEDLVPLKRFRAPDQDRLAPNRAKARDLLFARVLEAVWAVTSLGTPIVVEEGGQTVVRSGWWIAPLGRVATSKATLSAWFSQRLQELRQRGVAAERSELVGHHLAVNGFIDLRSHAIVASSRRDEDCAGAVVVARDEAELEAALDRLVPFEFFATCGLGAVLYRLRGLADYLQSVQMGLGTHFDAAWAMPRDPHGHTLVLPGIVEAFRMVSEGQEKGTGTEILDGFWGYRAKPRRS